MHNEQITWNIKRTSKTSIINTQGKMPRDTNMEIFLQETSNKKLGSFQEHPHRAWQGTSFTEHGLLIHSCP
jgi:hypothetical protein